MSAGDELESQNADYTTKIVIGVVLLVALVVYKMHPRSTFAADGLSQPWDDTVQRSRTSRTPVLVLFTADWCPSCVALHRDVLSRDEIQNEISGHYIFITEDLTGQNSAASARAQNFGVSGIPTLIRFDADGKETARTHYLSPSGMMNWLRDGEPSN